MNADLLVNTILAEMGGEVNETRRNAFTVLIRNIIQHIQVFGQVNVTTVTAGAMAGPTVLPGTGIGTIK